MGWREVYVLVAAGEEKGFPENPVLGEAPRDAAIDAAALSDLLARNEATVIDVSLSREYRARTFRQLVCDPRAARAVHPAGAAAQEHRIDLGRRRARRPRGAGGARPHAACGALSFGRQRGLARRRIAAHRRRSAHGGRSHRRVAEADERPDGVKQAMAEYLAWETDLLPRIARDGMCEVYGVEVAARHSIAFPGRDAARSEAE